MKVSPRGHKRCLNCWQAAIFAAVNMQRSNIKEHLLSARVDILVFHSLCAFDSVSVLSSRP
eukprot:2776-Heterococcus_DN1.PRE.1